MSSEALSPTPQPSAKCKAQLQRLLIFAKQPSWKGTLPPALLGDQDMPPTLWDLPL